MTKLCSDCPDHEACMTGYPCELVKRVNPPAYETMNWPYWTCGRCGKQGRARPNFPILCTCGYITWSGPELPVTLVWEGDYA